MADYEALHYDKDKLRDACVYSSFSASFFTQKIETKLILNCLSYTLSEYRRVQNRLNLEANSWENKRKKVKWF